VGDARYTSWPVTRFEAVEKVRSLPIYEYRCTNGHQFEVNQSMSDDPVTKCQMCRSKVQRVLYAPAIHFKGTGFHNTDYGTRKRPKDGDSGSSTTTAADTSSGTGDSATTTSGDSSTSSTDGAKPKVKEATPATTAARTTGP
jgi:putative FmdB family regulatory protein